MIKKIFVVGDVHDDRESLAAFINYAGSQEADKILFLGDFSLRPYTGESLCELIEAGTTEQSLHRFVEAKDRTNGALINDMKKILDSSGLEYLVIPGNYDPIISDVFEQRDLHKRTVEKEGVKIFGYGGSDAFPEHINLLAQLGQIVPFDHQELYDSLKRENPDIAVVHNPPQGMCDDMFNGQNVGTPSTARYIVEESPKLVLSGHIHEAGPLGNNSNGVQGIRAYDGENGRTVVVNPGNLGRFEIVRFPSLGTQMSFPHGTFVRVDIEDDGTPIGLYQYSLTGPEGKGNIGQVKEIGRYNLKE